MYNITPTSNSASSIQHLDSNPRGNEVALVEEGSPRRKKAKLTTQKAHQEIEDNTGLKGNTALASRAYELLSRATPLLKHTISYLSVSDQLALLLAAPNFYDHASTIVTIADMSAMQDILFRISTQASPDIKEKKPMINIVGNKIQSKNMPDPLDVIHESNDFMWAKLSANKDNFYLQATIRKRPFSREIPVPQYPQIPSHLFYDNSWHAVMSPNNKYLCFYSSHDSDKSHKSLRMIYELGYNYTGWVNSVDHRYSREFNGNITLVRFSKNSNIIVTRYESGTKIIDSIEGGVFNKDCEKVECIHDEEMECIPDEEMKRIYAENHHLHSSHIRNLHQLKDDHCIMLAYDRKDSITFIYQLTFMNNGEIVETLLFFKHGFETYGHLSVDRFILYRPSTDFTPSQVCFYQKNNLFLPYLEPSETNMAYSFIGCFTDVEACHFDFRKKQLFTYEKKGKDDTTQHIINIYEFDLKTCTFNHPRYRIPFTLADYTIPIKGLDNNTCDIINTLKLIPSAYANTKPKLVNA